MQSIQAGQTICVKGTLTDEGVECQALRASGGELFTLVGELGDYTVGDDVYVAGTVAEVSFCQQGTTLIVSWIGAAPMGARAMAA